jgi:hypothetical protein
MPFASGSMYWSTAEDLTTKTLDHNWDHSYGDRKRQPKHPRGQLRISNRPS